MKPARGALRAMGSRTGLLAGAIAALVWGTVALPAAALEPPPADAVLGELPALSTGEINFRLDAGNFLGAGGKNEVELYFAIPNSEIQFNESEGDFRGHVSVRAALYDTTNGAAAEVNDDIWLSAGTLARAKDHAVVQVVTERINLSPSRYRLVAEVEDLLAIKKVLLSQITGDHPDGQVTAAFDVRPLTGSPLGLSEIEFGRLSPTGTATGAGGVSPGDSLHQGVELVPNPARLYGLLLPELVAYIEVYPAEGALASASGGWFTNYRILGLGSRELFNEQTMGIQENHGKWGKTSRIDISHLEAGQYTLAIDIADAAGHVLASRRGAFEVAWSPYSWGRDPEDILDDMEPILTASEFTRLKGMSRGQAESFLNAYWKERDPTPGTPENELMEEHFRRIEYARQHYPAPQREGGLEDRGRIYVRYGPPDDTDEGFDDVFYTRPQDTNEARSQMTPEGPASPVADPSTDRLLDMQTREGVERALGTSQPEGKRYEVWYYDSRGTQLTRGESGVRRSPRMRFVFMDRAGTGDYTLVYSSERGDY